MTTQLNQTINVGDKVVFDNDKIEIFKAETGSDDKAVGQYQQLVLGGADQVGVVKEMRGNLTTISYPDGWVLPVPKKYLIVLP
ncbi:MAG: hypothetical protein Q8R50_07560 [Sediminibacterium sp.]|nr:hypothetical protein [Sediminibacterium sp.]